MTISGEQAILRQRDQGDARPTAPSLSDQLRERIGLTRMETVVACALAEGLSYKEIANRCCISYHTVHSHVKAIHQKARVPSNVRLLALIRKENWK